VTRLRLAAAVACASLLAPPAAPAKVLLEKVRASVDARGAISEHHRLSVLIEDPAEVERWASIPIYLDAHRKLIEVQGSVSRPGLKPEPIGERDQDQAQVSSGGVLHSSVHYQVVKPKGLAVGATLDLEYRLRSEPYWPGTVFFLGDDEGVDRVDVEVEADPAAGALRWRLDGRQDGLKATGDQQRVRVEGSVAKLDHPPALAGGGAVRQAQLRLAWGADAGWAGIGRWYHELLATVPRNQAAIGKLAAELTAGAATPRAKLEALVAHVRQKVRYVAVEVGIGGYRPHAPEQVIERLWGDCKDKSLLLVELARAVGLDATMVLIKLDEEARIDREFPSPFEFNHAIAAFRADPLEPAAGDPVAGGYFFVDPTQTQGAASYLHQGVQDQTAIVLEGEVGKVVRLPTLPQSSQRRMRVDVELLADGSAKGLARIDFEGDPAASLLAYQKTAADPARLESTLRAVFESTLGGGVVSDLRYAGVEEGRPTFSASATVAAPRLAEGGERGVSVQLGGLRLTPDPRDVERAGAFRAAAPGAGILDVQYQFRLPAGACPPAARTDEAANAVGSFRQRISIFDGGAVLVERHTELRQPWVEAAEYPLLQELAVAESRAQQRRIRFACKP
jgi:hypothetical protein